jgi:hypothetical protein
MSEPDQPQPERAEDEPLRIPLLLQHDLVDGNDQAGNGGQQSQYQSQVHAL